MHVRHRLSIRRGSEEKIFILRDCKSRSDSIEGWKQVMENLKRYVAVPSQTLDAEVSATDLLTEFSHKAKAYADVEIVKNDSERSSVVLRTTPDTIEKLKADFQNQLVITADEAIDSE